MFHTRSLKQTLRMYFLIPLSLTHTHSMFSQLKSIRVRGKNPTREAKKSATENERSDDDKREREKKGKGARERSNANECQTV